jgi:hypothetical protein
MSGAILITSNIRKVEVAVSATARVVNLAVDSRVRSVEVIQVARSLGPQGLSAYMVAVKNGFTGTETQWLESIMQGPEGKSAYELSGFRGTLQEWLQSLKGQDGTVPEIDIGDTVALFENNLL